MSTFGTELKGVPQPPKVSARVAPAGPRLPNGRFKAKDRKKGMTRSMWSHTLREHKAAARARRKAAKREARSARGAAKSWRAHQRKIKALAKSQAKAARSFRKYQAKRTRSARAAAKAWRAHLRGVRARQQAVAFQARKSAATRRKAALSLAKSLKKTYSAPRSGRGGSGFLRAFKKLQRLFRRGSRRGSMDGRNHGFKGSGQGGRTGFAGMPRRRHIR